MDEFISTYAIKSGKRVANHKGFRVIDIDEEEDGPVSKLKLIARHAIGEGDDAVLIVKKLHHLDHIQSFAQSLFNAIHTAVDNNFNFLLLDGILCSPVARINELISYVYDIQELRSFVITRPVLELILYIEIGQEEPSLETLFNTIVTHKAALNEICEQEGELSARRINIIVPFRNVEQFINSCCNSILSQCYENYRVLLIDDCSSDKSTNLIPQDSRFKLVRNTERRFALANILEVLDNDHFEQDDIIIILDGDDALSHKFVLSLINGAYNKEKCLVTYGSFRPMDSLVRVGSKYSKVEYDNLRNTTWKASHLKTFEYSIYALYRGLDPDLYHMRNKNREFYKMTYDMALMFPLMEIAGYQQVFFIKDTLYLYRQHEYNDHVVDSRLQMEIESEIRSKNSLKLL